MSELDKIILGGEVLEFIDRTARTLAGDAQSTANTANTTAQSAQSTANTANTTAQSAQNLANEIIAGFNTQFLQISTAENYIAPYYCKRNNEVFMEFPNIPFLKNVQANVWTNAFTMPTGFRPISQCYRSVNVGGTTTMLIEINHSGVVKVFPSVDYNTSFAIFGGFSFLTAN